MAQVRKYQSGGLVLKDELLIDIGGIKYLKSDVVNIFKNLTLRNSYSKDFVGNNEELDKLFNLIADIYAEGLDSGKMRFDSDGKHILDPSGQYYNIDKIIDNPKTELDYFNNQSVRVMDMFEVAKNKGYIRNWEGKVNDKTPYSFSETGILTKHYFHKPSDYKWSDLSTAWFALDPMDKTTKVRAFNNRKAALASAILKEADLIDNDPSYRRKYRFDGELTNPMAYKEYTKAMREYALMIANLNDFNESLLPLAAILGTNPRALYSLDQNDTESLFTPITEESLNYVAQQQQAEKDRLAKIDQDKKEKEKQNLEKLLLDIALNGILRNYDPLATENIKYFDNTTNSFYDITDDLSKITNLGLLLAKAFQVGYNKEQILKNWYSWEGFTGKYLQNLTNYFRNKSEYNIYAITNGPLGNAGKRFFAKRPYDKKPIEIKIKKVGVDYYAYDLKGNQLAKLGEYFYDTRKTAITSVELLNTALSAIKPTTLDKDTDTGEPFVFSTSLAFKGSQEMQAYWQLLGAIKISNYDPRRFEEILKGVSMLFLSLPTVDQYKYNWFNKEFNPRTWYGTRFALYEDKNGKIVFSWINGDNEIVFVSNLSKKLFYKDYLKTEGNIKYIAPGFINKVIKRKVSSALTEYKFDIIGYKNGGKLISFSVGGTLSDAYNNQVNNRVIKPLEAPKLPVYIQLPETQTLTDKEPNLLKEPLDFTVADGVRLGASILDLTGAFMLFPKGLNLASAAVSGVSLAGYIGADLMDVLEGRQELWPTLKRDAEIAGVLAIALINPVKAGLIAPALAKIVPMVPKIAGLLWTYDIINDDRSRQSIMDTLNKIQHWRVSDINSLDLTNLAFIGRTLIGAKMGLKSMKDKATKGINKIRNKASDIAEVKYQIKDLNSTSIQLARGSGKQKVDPDIKAIKLRIVDEYNKGLKEGEQAITLEDVTVFNELNLPITSGKVPLRFNNPDIMSESWAPGRLFERAILHGDLQTGHVTRQNTWLGQKMRNWLGEDFDVSFSDEAIMQRKQQRQIDSLARNLFGGINELKRTALDIAKLKTSESFKNANATELNRLMQDLLTSKGYIFLPKGMEETPLYEGALAKANELLQVAASLNSMSDLEAAGKILGVTDIDKATVWKSILPENSKKLVTSEMLRQAYSQFKQAINSNDYLKWLSSLHADLLTMAEHLSSQLPAKGEWNSSTEMLNKLQGYILEVFNRSSDPLIKEKFNAITDPTQLKNFILAEARKLLAEGKLRGSDMELILNAYNLVKNSNIEKTTKKVLEEPEQVQLPELEELLISEEVKSNIKNERQKVIDLEDSLIEAGISLDTLKKIRTTSDTEFNTILSSFSDYPTEVVENMKLYRSLPENLFINEEGVNLLQSAQTESDKKINALGELWRKTKQKEAEDKKLTQNLIELVDLEKKEKELLKQDASDFSEEKLANTIDEVDKVGESIRTKRTEVKENRQNLKLLSDYVEQLTNQISESDLKLTSLIKQLKKVKNKYAVHKSIRQQGVSEKSNIKNSLENINSKILDKLKEIKALKLKYLARLRVLLKNPKSYKEISKLNKEFEGLVGKINNEITILENMVNRYNTRIEEITEGIAKHNAVVYNKKGGNFESPEKQKSTIKKYWGGGYFPVGNGYKAAVLPNFDDPYGTGWNKYLNSWYSTIGSKLLEGMLELIASDVSKYLGTQGLIYKLNQQKSALDASWNDEYKKNNGAYESEDVGNYQKLTNAMAPIMAGISNAYANGRYLMYTGNSSSGEYKPVIDNLGSAITHDKIPLGNVKWLTANDLQDYEKLLQNKVGNSYKLVYDKNGYIYPVAATLTNLEEGEGWFYDGDKVKYSIKGGTGTDGKSGPLDVIPTLDVVTPSPSYNDNWLDWIKLGVSEIGTIDARNKIKFRPVKAEPFNLHGRVRTGNNAILTRLAYSNLFGNADTSSDARYNSAVRLNLGVNYVKALQDAFAKDREVFYNSLSESLKLQHDNIARQYEVHNTNLQNYIAALKYHDELNEQMTTKLWQNLENLLAKKGVDLDNLNKLKLARYWQEYSGKITELLEQEIRNLQIGYWNRLSSEQKAKYGNSIATYLVSPDFTTSEAGIEYNEKVKLLLKIHDHNINALINGLYTTNPKPITYKKTYDSTFKEGGQIQMAKKGSNINWAKVETARMINKSINESIKEANKNMRLANRELQKTIRSAASMMKKLNTQGLK